MLEEPIPLHSLRDSDSHDRISSLQNPGEVGSDGPDTARELPPVDKGRKAWVFCFCSFILETMVWGFGISYGIFQEYYMTHPPFNSASTVTISAIGTTSMGLQYGGALLVMLCYRRYPEWIRPTMWLGLILCASSLCLSSFATQVWQLIVLQGVMFGVGGILLYVPVIIWLPEWFSEKRGLATGLVFGGSGIGGFVFPLLMNALLRDVGFHWTLRIWAAAMAVISSLAMLGVQPRIPSPKFNRQQARPPLIPSELTFFRSPLFWSFITSTALQGLSYFPVALYIAVFTTSISSPLSATVVLSLFNSSSILGQIIIGHLSDRFPYPRIMFVSATGSSIAAFLLWGFSKTLSQVFVFAIIFGSLSGGFSSVWPVAATDCSRNKPELGPFVFGCFAATKGMAAVVGPILSGILHAAGKKAVMGDGSYGRFGFGQVAIFVGSCAAMTGVGSMVVATVRNRMRE
ncbi:hypothetical protein JAAARDRAFT_30903 [Jaapia argillacea MUCL 33604]|uniref:Major facilitator superfamily (MFS) profile domain-containing protein n=1 Tax=Jaapia argillacea MUCL 33604 TaxID=933084 RepID=A0A067Q3C9_9AGAM|nr:hypothetical protein JAAARDRAFT_30903 [Jaapia argillacea MUCL 33604]